MSHIVILGAGITGLSSGLKLSEEGHKVTILEEKKYVGGLSASFNYKDYVLDYGPHKIFTLIPQIDQKIKEILKKDYLEIKKKSRIYFLNQFFSYPIDFLEVFHKMGIKTVFRCFSSYVLKNFKTKQDSNDYESYLMSRFGEEIYKLLFKPYATKVWGPPNEISDELAKTRIIVPNLISLVINKILPTKVLSSEKIYYPNKGFGQLAQNIANKIKDKEGKIVLGAKILRIQHTKNKVTAITYIQNNKPKEIKPDFIISTIPVNQLPTLFNASSTIKEQSQHLKYQDSVLLYLFINRNKVLDDNWIFFPETRFLFNRISEHKNFNPRLVPENKTVITLEITNPAIICKKDSQIIDECLSNFLELGLIRREEVIDSMILRVKNAYPIYKKDFDAHLNALLDYFDSFENFITNGRQGLFTYNNVDHCMDMGFKAADCISDFKKWKDIRNNFSYKIID